MRLRNAKRLHNRDEIRHKRTGEVGYVLGEPELVVREKQKPFLYIPAQFPSLGFVVVTHDEVE